MANIRNNTTTIQSILETVKSLPEAGSGGVTPTGILDITKNDTYDVTTYAGVNVQVPVPESEDLGEITPSKESQTFDSATTGKLYSKVVIKAVDEKLVKSLYPNRVDTTLGDDVKASEDSILSGKKAYVNGEEVEGNIVTNDFDDLKIDSTDKSKVIVPKGYYAQNYSKSVGTGTLGKPSIDKTTGKVSSKVSAAGYLTTGASTPDNNLLELTTMEGNINNPIIPSTSRQTAVAANTYTLGAVYVKGDSNLKAENIKSGVSIFGVNGTYNGAALGSNKGLYGVTSQSTSSYALEIDFITATYNPKDVPSLPKAISIVKATNISAGGVTSAYYINDGTAWGASLVVYNKTSVITRDSNLDGSLVYWTLNQDNTILSLRVNVGGNIADEYTNGMYFVMAYFD